VTLQLPSFCAESGHVSSSFVLISRKEDYIGQHPPDKMQYRLCGVATWEVAFHAVNFANSEQLRHCQYVQNVGTTFNILPHSVYFSSLLLYKSCNTILVVAASLTDGSVHLNHGIIVNVTPYTLHLLHVLDCRKSVHEQ
jgi:hypothetical protein